MEAWPEKRSSGRSRGRGESEGIEEIARKKCMG